MEPKPADPLSPRLPFHRRFRSSISAPPDGEPTKSEEAQASRRLILSNLRDDWTYPPENTEIICREPIAYRQRMEGSSDSEPTEPYRFESPDAVTSSISDRKRKRRHLQRDEEEWNEGVRVWADRRNAWCGVDKSSNDSLSISSDESDLELPVFASIIPPSNSIRAAIKPNVYQAIYSKVVLQSLTPTVPIPLPDLVGSLIVGWKSEGNWPPRSSLEGTEQKGWRGNRLRDRGVGAVRKVLGFREPEKNDDFHFVEDKQEESSGRTQDPSPA